jgi:hypothetical protein
MASTSAFGIFRSFPRNGGVGGDHARDAALLHNGNNVVQLFVREVRRDLQQDGAMNGLVRASLVF